MSSAGERIRELTKRLREASRAYYQESREIMSNYEYDKLYDELSRLEQETGIVMAGSPTREVGYQVLSELPKVRHEKPMLSLAKTKEVPELVSWLGNQKGLLSWKMDGLTVVLTYENGALARAVTRGNGEIGEDVTPNARTFVNLPMEIAWKGMLILRGEAVMLYSTFNRVNQEIGEADARYKNPRNLCAGSVRQLNSEITAKRQVHFYAFSLVQADGVDFHNSREAQFAWLEQQGFQVVERKMVTGDTLPASVEEFSRRIPEQDVPSDGLVLLYDDIAYGQSLGRTAKFPRDSIAFKWKDEIQETVLREIDWSPSRTGLINPVAVFDPVELEGTTVTRASVHNISIMEELKLGVGDRITVYKANMIIPQIAENLTGSGVRDIPAHCPVCGGRTEIRQEGDAKTLYCTNSECPAKQIKSFSLFTSRDALNIGGLSEMTLEKLIGVGAIHEYRDIFHLGEHRDAILSLEGFGEKSLENLTAAADAARHTQLYRVIYGLGVAGIGLANAKQLCRAFDGDLEAMRKAGRDELTAVEGIGEVLANAWQAYFADSHKTAQLDRLLPELDIIPDEKPAGENALSGKTVVITGSLAHFANRRALQAEIEQRGGKVAGSVSAKTDWLVNNDLNSTSSKNQKARELGVPIVSEEEMMNLLGMGDSI